MSKRVDTSGLDTEFIIAKTDRSGNRDLKPDSVPAEVATPVLVPSATETLQLQPEPELPKELKESSKRKRSQTAGYKETFLKRNEMKTRQCVYISYDVHAVIAKLVRALVSAGNDISVGGYIDTVLSEHLQNNREEINEVYRQQQGDLL
jgi:hypothetical protein